MFMYGCMCGICGCVYCVVCVESVDMSVYPCVCMCSCVCVNVYVCVVHVCTYVRVYTIRICLHVHMQDCKQNNVHKLFLHAGTGIDEVHLSGRLVNDSVFW